MIDQLLMVVAVISFALVTAGIPLGRISPLGLGLFCWALTALV